jgi:hypothetical protein
MYARRCAVSLFVLAALVGSAVSAEAHGLIGERFLPATLATDDPFVADELSLPTIFHIQMPAAAGGTPATRFTSLSGEFSKRLSPNLGLSLGGAWDVIAPQGKPDDNNTKVLTGFENMDVTLKYVFFKSPAHETLLAAGFSWEVGGTGDNKKVGAEHFDHFVPKLYFGKGMGDLPDALEWLKPIAVTGVFGWSVPNRVRTQTISVADDGSVDVSRDFNPTVFQWGFSTQYSLQYLQSFVRDIGLPAPFNRMIPLVELPLQTPIDGPNARHTTGTVNPGIIWFGRYVQLGIEAVIPINTASGKNVGVLAQIHFYLDDIAPKIFTWTPFHGTLGPTQPR